MQPLRFPTTRMRNGAMLAEELTYSERESHRVAAAELSAALTGQPGRFLHQGAYLGSPTTTVRR
jgi:hypothetical protein